MSDSAVEERRLLADLDAVATIVYTSGTTAAPKGALITHGNFVGQVLNVAAAYTGVVREDGNTIIFLPMAHVLARGLQLTCLANGMRIAHLSDPRDVVPALGVLKPTFLVVVPRVLQKIQASAAGPRRRSTSGRCGRPRSAPRSRGAGSPRPATPTRRPGRTGPAVRRALFDRLFYARLRKLMGGRLDYLLSGAAALDAELSLFFRGLGLPVIEGYGLTETTAPLTGNMPGSIKAGTVGIPMPEPPCASRTRARCSPAASACSPATAGRPTTRRPSRTGSSAPATSASSTGRDGLPSRAGSRTSSSPRAARPSPPPSGKATSRATPSWRTP